jgi:hypothetical protein
MLPWNITVISDNPGRIDDYLRRDGPPINWFIEVKNALLYGSEVSWLPLDQYRAQAQTMLYAPYHLRYNTGKTLAGDAHQYFINSVRSCNLNLEVLGESPDPGFHTFRRYDLFDTMLSQVISQADVLLTNMGGKKVSARWWDAHSAAQYLMHALSGVLLPDVSNLPVEGIADLRERVGPELDGVRAEMLRLTDTLRVALKDRIDDRTLRHEARNLISTRLEPVVREANQITKKLLEERWKKFLIGAAKVFGLAGAGLIFPGLLSKAVEEALKTAESVAEAVRPDTDLKHSARFVLRAQSFLSKADNK